MLYKFESQEYNELEGTKTMVEVADQAVELRVEATPYRESTAKSCGLNHIDPFDYLTELQKRATELAQHPAPWMASNYPEALVEAGTSQQPG